MKIYSNYKAVNKFIYGFVENVCAIICIYNAAFAISTKAFHFCHKLTIRCAVFASHSYMDFLTN